MQAAILALCLFGAGYVWLRMVHDPAVRAEAFQRGKEDSTDARVTQMRAALRAQEIRHQREQLALQRRADSAVANLDTLTVRLIAHAPAELQGEITALQAAQRAALEAKDVIIAQRDRRITELLGQVSVRDSTIGKLQAQRNTRRAQAGKRIHCGPGAGFTVGLTGQSALGPTVACIVTL